MQQQQEHSPHVLPVEDLREILHIGETLPSTMHLPNVIRRCTPFLQIPMHPCLDCRRTILITHQCTNIGSHTNNLKYMKCLIWLYLMETSQHATAKTADIWA